MGQEVIHPSPSRDLTDAAEISAALAGLGDGTDVQATWARERQDAILARRGGVLVLTLARAPDDTPDVVEVVFDRGRHRYTFHASVTHTDGARVELGEPRIVQRSDRRRFPRTVHPDGRRNGIRLVDGHEQVVLLDLSLNGASFVVDRETEVGDRLPVEVVMDGNAAARVDFEVIRVAEDDHGRGVVASGRFLQPTLEDETVVSAEEALTQLMKALDGSPADAIEDALERLATPAGAEARRE